VSNVLGAEGYLAIIVAIIVGYMAGMAVIAAISRPPLHRPSPKTERERAVEETRRRWREAEWLAACARERDAAYESVRDGGIATYRDPNGDYVTIVGPLITFPDAVLEEFRPRIERLMEEWSRDRGASD